LETVVSAHALGDQWAVHCTRCGVLAIVEEHEVERYCTRHIGTHDLVAGRTA
jgi:hypothetical protein